MNDVPSSPARPSRKSWIRALVIAALIILAAVVIRSCLGNGASGPAMPEAGVALPDGAAILTIEPEQVATRIDIIGTVASARSIPVSARVSAYVTEIYAAAGDSVSAGQALVALDDREIREQLAAAEAQLNQAEAEYSRARRLFDKQATTQQALTAAESAYHSARAQAERAKVLLSYTRIEAPMDGIVTERKVEPGDLVQPGHALLKLYDPKQMRLEAAVPVRLVGKFALGQACEADLDLPARRVTARVSEIVSEIDPLSRTQKVKLDLEPGVDVLPGTFGRLWVEEDAHEAVMIPRSAVLRVGQLEMVQVVQGQRVMRRAVKTGPAHGDRIEILSGLKRGEQILAQPLQED